MSQHHQQLNQRRWQPVRRAALERDGYRCVECVEQGLGGAGKLEVHHITALHKSAELAYELDNLRTLCVEHHLEQAIPVARLEWRRYIANNFKELLHQ